MTTFASDTNTNTDNSALHLPADTIAMAEQHLRDILQLAFEHTDQHQAVVVYDQRCPLAVALTSAYRACLPNARFIDFDAETPEFILSALNTLQASDLAVLVQSTNFRLEAYRLRVELFKRGLKVIEHPHLARMEGDENLYYIESLAYDANYYRGTGNALKQKIDNASRGVIDSGDAELIFSGRFEPAKLNVGDYRQMNNVGGQFPIGEVFTESVALENVYGKIRIFAFGDTTFTVNRPEQPITLIVEKGQVVDTVNSTPEFDQVLTNIRADDSVVWVRELGFGMNKAFSKDKTVRDIGTYERMCGVHLSLGAKHGSYAKPHIKRGEGRHHVDVFAVTEAVKLDDEVVYRNGAWVV
jgi:aminopeptidase